MEGEGRYWERQKEHRDIWKQKERKRNRSKKQLIMEKEKSELGYMEKYWINQQKAGLVMAINIIGF